MRILTEPLLYIYLVIAVSLSTFNRCIFRFLVPDVIAHQGRHYDTFVKDHLNSFLRNRLELFSKFGNHLYFDELVKKKRVSLLHAVHCRILLSSDVLVKFVLVAIDSCCAIQTRLDSETKPGCAQELICAIEQTLVIIGGVIMHLIKRSDSSFHKDLDGSSSKEMTNRSNHHHRVAKTMLDELLHRCPMVSAPLLGFRSPVIIILFQAKYKAIYYTYLTSQCAKYSYHLMKLLVYSDCDLNATDHERNTILHTVISAVFQEIDIGQDLDRDFDIKSLTNATVDIVKLLLGNGSYPHAKNKQGKSPLDLLQGIQVYRSKAEDILIHFTNLFSKYECNLSLKYLAAKKISDTHIP